MRKFCVFIVQVLLLAHCFLMSDGLERYMAAEKAGGELL